MLRPITSQGIFPDYWQDFKTLDHLLYMVIGSLLVIVLRVFTRNTN